MIHTGTSTNEAMKTNWKTAAVFPKPPVEVLNSPFCMAMARMVKIGQYRTFVMKSAVRSHGRSSRVITVFLRHMSALTSSMYDTKDATKYVPPCVSEIESFAVLIDA
eukprot:4925908-Pleurochrysis_carterae.AAC.1